MTKQQLISHLLSLSRSLQNLADMLQNLPDTDFTDAWQPPTEISAEILLDEPEIKEPEIDQPKTEPKIDKTPDTPKPQPQPPFNPLAQLFGGLKLPNMPQINTPGANPLNLLNILNMSGTNPLGNLSNIGGKSGLNLPTTLTELHDNPQILNMVNQVAANPQTLSMLSQLTGQNPQQLQTLLQGLNPTSQAAAEAITETAAATPSAPNDISNLLSVFGNLFGGNLGQQPAVTPINNQPTPINNLPTNAAAAAMQAMPVTPATAHLDNLLAQWHWQPYARVWKM